MPLRSRLRCGATLAAAIAVVLAQGCDGGGPSISAPAHQLRRGIGESPDTLDPQKFELQWAADIVGDMFVGLVTDDASGRPIPGVAESWTVSEDGLVWTFKLKPWSWSDGAPLTADDFVFAFRRLLAPATAAPYASIQFGLKNAAAVNSGAAPPENLGVRAIDAQTLEIALDYPQPYLLELMKHFTAMPLPRHAVEKFGDAWVDPANIVVNGPYKLTEWRAGDLIRLQRNDRWEGAQKLCFWEVTYYPGADQGAMVRQAQAGRIDMNNGLPLGQLAKLNKKLPGWLRLSPLAATTFVVANTAQPPFDDARVRRALAMAIDRETLANGVLKDGPMPSYSFVPPGMHQYGAPARFVWSTTPLAKRLEDARALLQQTGFGANKPLEFEFVHSGAGDSPRIAAALAQEWGQIADWVRPSPHKLETQVLLNQLQQRAFTIAEAGWAGDFNDAYNFLYLLDSRAGPTNYGGYSNPAFDALLDTANHEMDAQKRAALLKRAEQLILDDAAVMPMLTRVAQDLVSPSIAGYTDNAEDIHRSRFMCRAPGGKRT